MYTSVQLLFRNVLYLCNLWRISCICLLFMLLDLCVLLLFVTCSKQRYPAIRSTSYYVCSVLCISVLCCCNNRMNTVLSDIQLQEEVTPASSNNNEDAHLMLAASSQQLTASASQSPALSQREQTQQTCTGVLPAGVLLNRYPII